MTADENAIRLTPDARRHMLPVLPGQPADTSYGVISSGVDMPRDGLCYIVQFIGSGTAQILAYADEYGRIFETSQPEKIPPARYPSVTILNYSDVSAIGCVNVIDSEGTGHRIAELQRELAGYRFINTRVSMPDLPKTDLRGTCGIAYLAFRYFPHINGTDAAIPHIADVIKILRDHPPLEAFRTISEQSRTARATVGARPLALVDYLAAQLDETGLTSPDPTVLGEGDGAYPAQMLRLARLEAYSDTFYVDFDAKTASPDAARALLGAESALNRFMALARWAEEEGTVESLTLQQCADADRWLRDRICMQAPDPSAALHGRREWATRMALATTIEKLRLPLRTESSFRLDLAKGALAMDVMCPDSSLMPSVEQGGAGAVAQADAAAQTDEARNADEARYAAHVALLYAACGFSANAAITSVLANVWRSAPGAEAECIVTLDCTRQAFEALFAREPERVFADPFAALTDLDAAFRFAAGFHLEAVEPKASIHDALYCPEKRFVDVDECDAEFDAETAELLGAARVSDLSIFEDRQRRGLADSILAALEKGPDEGIAAAKDIHDRTENVLIRGVCDRVMKGIADGEIDAGSYLELHEAFADLYGLKAARMRADKLMETDQDSAQPLFEDIVRVSDAGRWFEDTPRTCYRFFDSYPARVLMAKIEPEEKRRILPLADEVFLAHDRLAYLLCDSFDAGTLGLQHSDAACAMAPTQTSCLAHAARTYYFLGDFASEIKECKALLARTISRQEAALAYYWLGYAYWKTGRPELGAICYRRCIEADGEYTAMAIEELEDLRSENKALRPLDRQQEDALLDEEGVPHRAARENAEFLLRAAQGAVDAESFTLARTLLAAAIPHIRDDALYPVFRSLEP